MTYTYILEPASFLLALLMCIGCDGGILDSAYTPPQDSEADTDSDTGTGEDSDTEPYQIFNPEDFLKTDGTLIKRNEGNGNSVQLIGVNFGGAFIQEYWMTPLNGAPNEYESRKLLTERFGEKSMRELVGRYHRAWITDRDFELMEQEGINLLRLGIYYQEFMRPDGTWYNDEDGNFAFLDWVVKTAYEHGIWTIIDMRGAPGSQNGADHSGREEGPLLFDEPDTYQPRCIAVWEKIARHYRGNPAVAGYDLLNQPSDVWPLDMTSKVNDLYFELYDAIRAIDPDHIIFMNAIWEWEKLFVPKNMGWENVVVTTQYYALDADRDAMLAAAEEWVREIDQMHQDSRWGIPHLLGEFTVSGGPWSEVLTQYTQAGWNWALWTFKLDHESPWGLYNYIEGSGSQVPDVSDDSFEDILDKWETWTTEGHFQRNQVVGEAFDAVFEMNGPLAHPNGTWLE